MRWVWALVMVAVVGCSERAPEPRAGEGAQSSRAADAAHGGAGDRAVGREAEGGRGGEGGERSLTVASLKRPISEFLPSRDGFGFANDFSGEVVPLGSRLGLPTRFGLCGGMSFAAADYFLAGKAVPRETTPPKQGTPLYSYLYVRQAASNGVMGTMGMKFLEWMKLSDEEVRRRTREEVPGMVGALSRGEPVVIGEVLQSEGGKAWENHQVLAYAASVEGGETRIRIYDPNFPKRDDVAIVVKGDGSVWRVGGGRKDREMRGIFRMGYEAAGPR